MATSTIRLPEDLRSELDKLSRDENKAVSDIVRESQRRHVAAERLQAIRRQVLPFAEAQGLLTPRQFWEWTTDDRTPGS